MVDLDMHDSNDLVGPFNNPLIRFVAEPAYRWLRHTIFILVGLLLAFKEDSGLFNSLRPPGLQRAILLQDSL
ncbi:MAG TPA: hypothetical protein VFV68_06850, partial [Agriterribacter sp.]|nr:hypothetical protein [Agriterribacter sp.]